jgi:hypothetical protein
MDFNKLGVENNALIGFMDYRNSQVDDNLTF